MSPRSFAIEKSTPHSPDCIKVFESDMWLLEYQEAESSPTQSEFLSTTTSWSEGSLQSSEVHYQKQDQHFVNVSEVNIDCAGTWTPHLLTTVDVDSHVEWLDQGQVWPQCDLQQSNESRSPSSPVLISKSSSRTATKLRDERRRAQNRVAQRAYRARQQQELVRISKELAEAQQRLEKAATIFKHCTSLVQNVKAENVRLRLLLTKSLSA